MAGRVSIVIPTQRRPGPLILAARSALAQARAGGEAGGVDPARLELVVVDNDAVPSAREAAAILADEAAFPVIYVHEPRPGVAFARNRALEAAGGELIAFLDDDEEAPPHWLAALLAVQAETQADVVFGPVRGRAPQAPARHRAYLEGFFSRPGQAQVQGRSGLIDHFYGCGNSLVRRAAYPDPAQPYDPSRNAIGGEDDLLYARMQARGARFAWAHEAFVWEDPAPERLRLSYALARAFAYGQGPSAHCAAADPPDRLGLAGWMLVGLAQAAVFGGVAAVQAGIGSPRLAFTLDRAARGLGKTLWWGPFKIAFYGLPAAAAGPVRADTLEPTR